MGCLGESSEHRAKQLKGINTVKTTWLSAASAVSLASLPIQIAALVYFVSSGYVTPWYPWAH